MRCSSHLSNRAYVAARPVLRRKLGFNQANYVAQCYQCLRIEYEAIAKLTAQLEFELMMTEITIILAQQSLMQRRDIAFVDSVIRDWDSTGLNEDRDSPQGKLLHVPTATAPNEDLIQLSNMTISPPSTVNMKQHADALRACVKTIHSLIASFADESCTIKQLLDEVDSEALSAFRHLDELHNEVDRSNARVRGKPYMSNPEDAMYKRVQARLFVPKSRVPGAAKPRRRREDIYTTQDELGRSQFSIDGMLNAELENHGQGANEDATDSDPGFVFV